MKDIIDPSAVSRAPLRYFLLLLFIFMGGAVIVNDLLFALLSWPTDTGTRKYFLPLIMAGVFFIRAWRRERKRDLESKMESK